MRHISTFSGIGGFDLASEWMGWENIASCEINPFGQKVLKHYWPDAYHHDDIHTLTKQLLDEKLGQNWNTGDVVLTGGFPCQPYSAAGKRLGKEDDRHLWPQMLRLIREISPRWIVGENVRGLTNWNGGLVFDEVQADLESSGYEVTPFLLPAVAVNAPHRRDRIWFIAHSKDAGAPIICNQSTRGEQLSTGSNIDGCLNNGPTPNATSSSSEGQHKQRQGQGEFRGCNSEGPTPHANSGRQPSKEHGKTQSGRIAKTGIPSDWQNFPTQPPICGGDDGLPSELDGITLSKWRNESIKAYGNAIVPQVAFEIFKAIQEYENLQP